MNSKDLAKRGESLIRHSTNRYLTTVRIAFRAKQRRFDDFDGLLEESTVKPVQRAIIELSDEQDQPDLLPGQLIKKEGPGWRLIRDPSRGYFSTLIGGGNWAIELTESEWDSFVQVVFDLHQQYLDVQDQLMGDEDITLEIERNPWFAILKGDR